MVKLSQLLWVALAFCVFFFCAADMADARGGGGGGGGCFGQGTSISTPEGYKSIEQLHSGDRVTGYNVTTHQVESGTIGEIQVIAAPDYYLLNHQIKVTGTHPFYVQTATGIDLVETQQLALGDRLIGEKETAVVVSSLDRIAEPITVYNLMAIEPTHNFYADGALVHNKGGGGGGGHGWSGGGGTAAPLTLRSAANQWLALAIAVGVWLPVAFSPEIYNFFRFKSKPFTENPELIEFTKTIRSNFANRYSVKYSWDDDRWRVTSLKPELEESQYQYLVSRTELIEQVRILFARYQQDRMNKDFAKTKEYIFRSFYVEQPAIFKRVFGEGFDIIYDAKLLEVTPLSYRFIQDVHVFRVQINAEMINFSISPEGYVCSGTDQPRSFTEFWDIALGSDQKCYLKDINQIYWK